MWKRILFNAQNIEHETSKAALIKMPKKSKFKGWMFWHPLSMIKQLPEGNGYLLHLNFPENWEFKLIKKGCENLSISHEELSESFGHNDNDNYDKWAESYVREYHPEKIEIDEVEVDESLLR